MFLFYTLGLLYSQAYIGFSFCSSMDGMDSIWETSAGIFLIGPQGISTGGGFHLHYNGTSMGKWEGQKSSMRNGVFLINGIIGV